MNHKYKTLYIKQRTYSCSPVNGLWSHGRYWSRPVSYQRHHSRTPGCTQSILWHESILVTSCKRTVFISVGQHGKCKTFKSIKEFLNPEDEWGVTQPSTDQDQVIGDDNSWSEVGAANRLHIFRMDNSCYESISVMSYEWTVFTKTLYLLRRDRRCCIRL